MPQYVAPFSLLFFTSIPSSTEALNQQRQELIIPEANETMSRHLDVSRECELNTMDLWDQEIIKWISPFEIDCEVSPCDYSQVEPTFHAEYKAQCQDIGGKFVEYTYKFNQEWRDLYNNNTVQMLEEQAFVEVLNAPDCIAPSCSASQYAHFLQGIRQSDESFDKDSIFIFYQDKDLSQCLNHDLDLLMPEPISPLDVQCDLSPCNVKTTAPDYYDNVQNTCMSINETFVEYTIVVYEVLYGVQNSYESKIIHNYPKCISQNCSSVEDFASYYQGFFPNGVYVITQNSTIDTRTSSSFRVNRSSFLSFFVVVIGLWNI